MKVQVGPMKSFHLNKHSTNINHLIRRWVDTHTYYPKFWEDKHAETLTGMCMINSKRKLGVTTDIINRNKLTYQKPDEHQPAMKKALGSHRKKYQNSKTPALGRTLLHITPLI